MQNGQRSNDASTADIDPKTITVFYGSGENSISPSFSKNSPEAVFTLEGMNFLHPDAGTGTNYDVEVYDREGALRGGLNFFANAVPRDSEGKNFVTQKTLRSPIVLNNEGGTVVIRTTLSFKVFSSTKLQNEYDACWNVQLRYVNTKK